MLKKIAAGFVGLIIICMLILVGWYQIDGIPAEETSEYLTGEGYSSEVHDDGSLTFTPDNPNGFGVNIMHGALIKPLSYVKSAAWFAQQGYTVHLPYGGIGRLSISASKSAAEKINNSDLQGWFLIGHSMGGMASLSMIADHGVDAMGVALWATSMPQDFSELDTPILYIWGDTDGLLPLDRFEWSQSNLPADVEYITLEGANHKNFAMYTHQFFDMEAKLDWMEQIDFANRTTTEFFDSLK
ncbi:MAG: alpha/beta hydrolase [Gammaproteobacteria bacterium]